MEHMNKKLDLINHRFKGGVISTDEEKSALISFMNESWAVIMSGGSTSLVSLNSEGGVHDPAFMPSPQQNFRLVTNNYSKVVVGEKTIHAATFWLAHQDRREFKGIIFDPEANDSEFLNLFKGFRVEPVEGDCSLYLELIYEVICQSNREAYEYVLNWMAHLIQRTSQKPETALVLRGGQGTGKTTFAEILGHLLGRHYICETNMEHVIGKFNASMADKVLIFCDEAIWGGERSKVGALKTFITSPTIQIEHKGVDPIGMPHYARLILASNEAWAVHADPDDRRFVFLDVADTWARDKKFFSPLYQQMKSGGYEALLFLLQTRDISEFEPRDRPNTGFGQDILEMSMTPSQRFWLKVLEEGRVPIVRKNFNYGDEIHYVDHTVLDGTFPNWERIPKPAIYEAYRQNARKGGERIQLDSEFFLALHRMLGLRSKEDRKALDGGRSSNKDRLLRLLPLAHLRALYDQANGRNKDWEEPVHHLETPPF